MKTIRKTDHSPRALSNESSNKADYVRAVGIEQPADEPKQAQAVPVRVILLITSPMLLLCLFLLKGL